MEGEDSYKIGISKNPEKRIKQLQTGTPNIISLVYKFESEWASKIEGHLHIRYSLDRLNGEWFKLTKDTVNEFLANCRKIDYNLTYIKENSTIYN